jgi:hypothetical protein
MAAVLLPDQLRVTFCRCRPSAARRTAAAWGDGAVSSSGRSPGRINSVGCASATTNGLTSTKIVGVVVDAVYGLHRSGEDDDAFPYFHELIRTGSLLPTEDDYTALFDDPDHGGEILGAVHQSFSSRSGEVQGDPHRLLTESRLLRSP